MTDMIHDSTLNVLQAALDGLSERQQVISNNIANAETPGYHALAVSFENQLQNAMTGSPVQMAVTEAGHLSAADNSPHNAKLLLRQSGAARLDGNNVDVDMEMTELAETSIRFQSLTQIVTKKLALLKAIATSR
jgi:flagellar basal-body rod protein FlgB